MRHFLVCFCLLYFLPICAQTDYNFTYIDKHAKEIPFSLTQSLPQLILTLTKPAQNDLEKVRSIYVWIAHNINYDYNIIAQNKLGTSENARRQSAYYVYKSRKAVCEGYANLFNEMCQYANIRSKMVTGLVKDTDGEVANIGHAWNSFKINNTWHLVDVTWSAGKVNENTKKYSREFDDSFFMPNPNEFIYSHLPYDPIWQLSQNLVSKEAFLSVDENIKIELKKYNQQPYHFIDTLKQWEQLSDVEQNIESFNRIIRFDPANSIGLIKLTVAYVDKAFEDYWTADSIFRYYVEKDKEVPNANKLKQMLQTADTNIVISSYYIQQIPPSDKMFSTAHETLNYIKGLRAYLWYEQGSIDRHNASIAVEKAIKKKNNLQKIAPQIIQQFLNAQNCYARAEEYLSEISKKEDMAQQLTANICFDIGGLYFTKASMYFNAMLQTLPQNNNKIQSTNKKLINDYIYNAELAFNLSEKYFQKVQNKSKLKPVANKNLVAIKNNKRVIDNYQKDIR